MEEPILEPKIETDPIKKPKKRFTCLLIVLFVFGALTVWAWPFLPEVIPLLQIYCARDRSYNPKSCIANLNELNVALSLYREENEKFPAAESWADTLELYIRAADLKPEDQIKKLKCPIFQESSDDWGYAFNGQLSAVWMDRVTAPETTPVLYDSSKLSKNAFDEIPLDSIATPPRHEYSNIMFADGHVAQHKGESK